MMIRRGVATVLTGAAAVCVLGAAQKAPPVADVLRAASEYVATYAPKISGVTLDEEYTLLDVSGGQMTSTKRLNSDLVLLNLSGRVVALRDAYAIDSNPLRERQPRITALLAKPSAAAWERAQAFTGESYRYLHLPDDLIGRANDPTLALQLVATANQTRVTYKIDGRKRLDGVEVVGLRFQETKRPDKSYIVATTGNAAAFGRLWIDPGTGRIHRTELTLESTTENAHVEVTYGRDPGLDLWLPRQMVDLYDIREPTGSNSYSHRSYQGRADYSNPRLTPIELATPK